MKKCAFIIGLAWLLPVSAVVAAQSLAQNPKFRTEDGTLTLAIGFSTMVQPRVYQLHSPPRLVINVENTRLLGELPPVPVGTSVVRAIRSGISNAGGLSFVLDLTRPLVTNDAGDFEDFWVTADRRTGYSLVVVLGHHNPGTAKYGPVVTKMQRIYVEPIKSAVVPAKTASQVAFTANTTAATNAAGTVDSIGAIVSQKLASKAIPRVVWPAAPKRTAQPVAPKSRKSQPAWSQVGFRGGRDLLVAIDPGHGGKDSGAIGPDGTREKDVVLAIGKRLASLIDAEAGMKAFLTRSTDVFIPLRQRIRKARRVRADLFISIHADAAYNSAAQGASVYTLSERGASSEAAKMLADKENAADLVGDLEIDEKDDLLAHVLMDMSLGAVMEAGRQAAVQVLGNLYNEGEIHKEDIQFANFAVLKAPDIPAMLVETAFISNPEEEQKLCSSVFQNRIANAVFRGVRDYFRTRPPLGTRMAQTVQQRRLNNTTSSYNR